MSANVKVVEKEKEGDRSNDSKSNDEQNASEFDSCESSSGGGESTTDVAAQVIAEDRVAIGDECVICLDAMGASPVLMLACAHEFHETCLKAWLANPVHQSCPLCRHAISVELISQIMGIPEAEVTRAAADALGASRSRVGGVVVNVNVDERRIQRRHSDSSSGDDVSSADVQRRMVEEGILLDPPEPQPYVFNLCAKFCCCLMIFAAVIYLLSWIL